MREPPSHVIRRIHERDPLADVRWDERLHVWTLYWDNVRICTLFHEDGSDMLELCADEVLDIMGRYDNYNDGAERIRSIRATAANARAKAEKRRQQAIEESAKEASAVTDTLLSGASPQYHVTDNPLYKKEDRHASG